MSNYLKQIGQRIRRARAMNKLSQAQLAALICKSQSYISNIERGKQNISVLALQTIANALNLSADWFLQNNYSPASIPENISRLLKDCNSAEQEALVHLSQSVKQILRDYQHKQSHK